MSHTMKIGFLIMTSFSVIIIFNNCSSSKKSGIDTMNAKENELVTILDHYPLYFDSILKRKDELNVQVIYTRIDRDKNNTPSFKDFYFNVNDNNYFYPASTVKFPVAVL